MSGFEIPKNRTYNEKHEMMMNFNRAEILSRLRSSDESIQQIYQQNGLKDDKSNWVYVKGKASTLT